MGFLAVVSGIAALFLPETLNQYLPETLEEAELHAMVGQVALRSHWNRLKSAFKKKKKTPEELQQNAETSLHLIKEKNEEKIVNPPPKIVNPTS